MGRKKNSKSGGLGFAIPFLIITVASGFNPLWILLGVGVGLGIGKLTSIMSSGLDTTTHNREDVLRRQQEAEAEARRQQEAQAEARRQQEAANLRRQQEQQRMAREAASRIPLTGDATADAVITKGMEIVAQIRRENAAIPDPRLSSQMESICEKCEQIFRAVSESPSKAPQVRKFMNYYLPTTLKILANYRTMQNRGVSFKELTDARDTSVRGLNMILTACQKQIDSLHKENLMDISTDIDVLEQMLKRDGYVEGEFSGLKDSVPASEPMTAAEAQMRASSVPVMNFPIQNGTEEEFSSPKQKYEGS